MHSVDCKALTQVLHRTNLLGLSQTLFKRDRIRIIIHFFVLPQIALERGEHDPHARAILADFGNPLGPDILEGVGAVDLYIIWPLALSVLGQKGQIEPYAKAQHQDVCILVG